MCIRRLFDVIGIDHFEVQFEPPRIAGGVYAQLRVRTR
jgi:hypothetical protein